MYPMQFSIFFHRFISDRSKRFKVWKEKKKKKKKFRVHEIKKKEKDAGKDPLRENPWDWAGVLLNRGWETRLRNNRLEASRFGKRGGPFPNKISAGVHGRTSMQLSRIERGPTRWHVSPHENFYQQVVTPGLDAVSKRPGITFILPRVLSLSLLSLSLFLSAIEIDAWQIALFVK